MAWNNSNVSSRASSGSGRGAARRLNGATLLCIFLIGIVVVVAGLAIWHSGSRESTAGREGRTDSRLGKIAEQEPAIPVRNLPARKVGAARQASADEVAAKVEAPALPPNARTNVLGEVVVGESVVHSNVFRTGCEQVMAWIFACERGNMPPILPNVTIRDEQQFIDIFTKPLETTEGEDERTKDAKESVEFAKKELFAYLKEGGTVQDFLKFYREQLMNDFHERNDAQRMAMDMYRNGEDKAVCDAFVKKMNERLAEKGIRQFDIPEAFIRKYSEEN